MSITRVQLGTSTTLTGSIVSLVDFRGGSVGTDDTTNPITLYSFTAPANSLAPGGGYRVYLGGTFAANAHVKLVTLNIGATILATLTGAFNNKIWLFEGTILGVTVNSQSAPMKGLVIDPTAVAAVTGTFSVNTSNIDYTADQIISVVGTNAAITQAGDTTWHLSIVEYLGAYV